LHLWHHQFLLHLVVPEDLLHQLDLLLHQFLLRLAVLEVLLHQLDLLHL
jgi:hypothetical protein